MAPRLLSDGRQVRLARPPGRFWGIYAGMRILLTSLLLVACGTTAAPQTAPANTPAVERAAVRARLEEKLEVDPHRGLCEALVAELARGNADAMVPYFDHASFVERVIASGAIPEEMQAALRADPSGPAEFSRIHFPPGSQFLCLGTRSLFGEDTIAIRNWQPGSRFDYALLHLSGNPERPIDDYMVVSGGTYHSYANALYFTPALRAPMETVGNLLLMSHEHRFQEIIDTYRGLPESVRSSPTGFLHFINAVFTLEQTGSPLYLEAIASMERIFRDHPYSLAYWRLLDGARRNVPAMVDESRGQLLELLDDYELLGP